MKKMVERSLQEAVTTTNKYFIGLLCGSGYTRSSCLTLSQVDAGIVSSESEDGRLSFTIGCAFVCPAILCQMSGPAANFLLDEICLSLLACCIFCESRNNAVA